MELTKQVSSLDLAKRLKELGVKQDAMFTWIYDLTHEYWRVADRTWGAMHDDKWDWADAFTVAELGEMLSKFPKEDYRLYVGIRCCSLYSGWEPNNSGGKKRTYLYRDNEYKTTEADARTKMLIYLLENNLITL